MCSSLLSSSPILSTLQFASWVDAVILVFSLENESSFQEVYRIYHQLAAHRPIAEIAFVVVGTQGETETVGLKMRSSAACVCVRVCELCLCFQIRSAAPTPESSTMPEPGSCAQMCAAAPTTRPAPPMGSTSTESSMTVCVCVVMTTALLQRMLRTVQERALLGFMDFLMIIFLKLCSCSENYDSEEASCSAGFLQVSAQLSHPLRGLHPSVRCFPRAGRAVPDPHLSALLVFFSVLDELLVSSAGQ